MREKLVEKAGNEILMGQDTKQFSKPITSEGKYSVELGKFFQLKFPLINKSEGKFVTL